MEIDMTKNEKISLGIAVGAAAAVWFAKRAAGVSGIGKINPNRNGWTRVIFRKYPDGEIIALFPDEKWDAGFRLCASYMHFGGHSGADYNGVIHDTKPATVSEYEPLLNELFSMGYNYLEIAKRQ